MRPVTAISNTRHRASPSERRLHGGSTVTRFYVHFSDAPTGPGNPIREIEGYGPTPGDRKTFAIRKFLEDHYAARP